MNDPEPAPDEPSEFLELMERVRSGSPEAWAEVVRDYVPALKCIARRKLPHLFRRKMGDSDLVQETLLIASQQFTLFVGRTTVEFAHWLEGILNRVAEHAREKFSRTAKRNIAREVPFERAAATVRLPADYETPDRIAERKERSRFVTRAMEQLSPLHRSVMEMHYDGKLSFAEIGQRIGRSEQATRALLRRACHRMAELLGAQAG